MLLALAPLGEMLVELLTLVVGATYLCFSENTEELILNAVAVNFVTQIDDVMLMAFVHKASRERLSKYQYEQLWGVEEGDTQLKNVSEKSKRIARLQELLPLLVLLLAASAVGVGQVYGRFVKESDTCTFVLPPDEQD